MGEEGTEEEEREKEAEVGVVSAESEIGAR